MEDDLDNYAVDLAEFLNGQADLQQIWDQFDVDGNGFIDEREFEALLYMCLAVFFASRNSDDVPIPSPAELEVQIDNLREVLVEQMDTNNDGVIDRVEFEKMGEYLRLQYDNMKEGKINSKDGPGLNLASILDELCNEVEETDVIDSTIYAGTTRYVGGQIVDYKSDDFVSWGAFFRLQGTVLVSRDLWKKIGLLALFLTAGYVTSRYVGAKEIFDNIEEMRGFMDGLDALLAFFAGMYLDIILGRWWTMRSEGVGGVINAVTDISLSLAGLLHANTKEEEQVKNLVLRYGLLSHALIYGEARDYFLQKDHEYWDDLMAKGLIVYREMKVLKKVRRKPEAVWGWILSYIESCTAKGILPEDRLVHFTDMCREGRKACGLITLHLTCQLPLPYVHLICIVINLYQTVLAFTSGMIICTAVLDNNEQEIIVQIVRFLLYNIIYQGIMETAEKMTNPLGDDDIDFPQLFIHYTLEKECRALYDLGVQLPWDATKSRRQALEGSKRTEGETVIE